MPPNAFCDTKFHCRGTDQVTHDGLGPIRLLTTASWAGEDPILWPSIVRTLAPFSQRLCQVRIKGNWFLRRFGLARPNYLENDRTRNINFTCTEIDVSPLQGKQFADSQTSADIEQHKGSFSEGKRGKKFLDVHDPNNTSTRFSF